MTASPEPAQDPKAIVAEGYDRVGGRYARLAVEGSAGVRTRYEDVLLAELSPGAKVLDLGCGAGIPTTRRLAERFAVTGVDISERQIARARQNVPEATFVCADMATLDFPPGSFDGVAAFYSIIHLPRDEQATLLEKVSAWLRPGGIIVATLGVTPVEAAYEDIWLGAPMFWSSYDGRTNRGLVEASGLQIVSAREETSKSPDGGKETFLWVVAQKPADASDETS